MDTQQQPDISNKITNLGSTLGAALMAIGGTPAQRQQAKAVLNPPAGSKPSVAVPDPNSPASGTTPNPADTWLSGLSGIRTASAANGANLINPLLPVGTPMPPTVGGVKLLLP